MIEALRASGFDVSPGRWGENITTFGIEAVLERDPQGNLIRKAGIMGVVHAGGEVRAGDAIRIEVPDGPRRPLEPV